MLKKTLIIFGRDLKVSIRDFMSLLLMVVPIILAVAVNFFAPGIEDTTVNLAYIEGENPQMVSYLEDYANVRQYKDYDALEARVIETGQRCGHRRRRQRRLYPGPGQ